MTDDEVGLVKAMLDRGFKNDQAHFYFNRIDRLVSSGRITQIKQGKYGAKVPSASAAELDAFLERWAELRLVENGPGALTTDHSRIIVSLFDRREPHWIMRTEETHRAECKQTFRLKPEHNFGDTVKTIAAFANNSGGISCSVSTTTPELRRDSSEIFLRMPTPPKSTAYLQARSILCRSLPNFPSNSERRKLASCT